MTIQELIDRFHELKKANEESRRTLPAAVQAIVAADERDFEGDWFEKHPAWREHHEAQKRFQALLDDILDSELPVGYDA